MFRRLAIAVLVATPLLGAMPAASAGGVESISSLYAKVVVTDTGVMQVTETIDYDFADKARHGIIRAIPLWDDLPNNQRRQYALSIEAVTVDGAAATVSESDEGAFRMVTIGDADRTISGVHRYVIQFSISNALTVLTQADLSNAPGVEVGDVELYWDFVGDGWSVPIASAQVDALMPGAPLLTRCYFGAAGRTAECAHASTGRVTSFGPVSLNAHEALTGVLSMPRAAFVSIGAADINERPASLGSQFAAAMRFAGPLGVLFAIWLVRRARRRRDAIVTVPVTDFVRFEAPPGLRPAEASVAWKGTFDGRVLTATLLDLAARGAVIITPKGKKRIDISRTEATVELAAWEQSIVNAALKESGSAEVGKYNAQLSKAVQNAGRKLKQRAETSGIRNAKASRPRLPWFGLIAAGSVGLVLALPLFVVPPISAALLSVGLAMLIGGIIGARIVPLVQTQASADFLSSVHGFRKLLDTDAGAARREFAHRSGLPAGAIFATMLPWAVIYGVDEAWAGAFPDLTPDDLHAYGLGFVSASVIHSDLASATRALSSAMTNPASSGSGSSGGSSGGGGGGGGGSSW